MLWAKFANFVVSFGQILKKYLAIWSHCLHTNFLCHTLAHQTDSIHCSISLSHTVLVRGLQQCYIAFSLSHILYLDTHTHMFCFTLAAHTHTHTVDNRLYIYLSFSLTVSLFVGWVLSLPLALSLLVHVPSLSQKVPRSKFHDFQQTSTKLCQINISVTISTATNNKKC